MKKCTNHCGHCGRHFRSVAAFDKHRDGPFSGERVCLAPVEVKGRDGGPFYLEEPGDCAMYSPDGVNGVEHDVILLSDREGVERAREAWGHNEPEEEPPAKPPRRQRATGPGRRVSKPKRKGV